MTVQVIGDKEVAAKFMQAAANLKASQRYWVWDCGQAIQESITESIVEQGLVKSGNLARSVRTFGFLSASINVGAGKGVVGESGSPYAWALEVGAVPHPITPRAVGGLLVFEWDKSPDGWFVGPYVNHPGVKPYRYVRRGAESSMFVIALIMKEYIQSALMM